ncbi:hypothetical protein [Novosphingobium terrae]|nr:hypothetical protein [Novosphingobium terrae]
MFHRLTCVETVAVCCAYLMDKMQLANFADTLRIAFAAELGSVS